jgi:hypothetical protein
MRISERSCTGGNGEMESSGFGIAGMITTKGHEAGEMLDSASNGWTKQRLERAAHVELALTNTCSCVHLV